MQLLNLLDRYGRLARLYPAVLTLAPLLAIPGVSLASDITVSVSAVSLAVIALFYGLTHWVRTLGKKAERDLLARWGGWPTTRLLRWGDRTLDPTTKTRYHTYLRDRGLTMPTPADEYANTRLANEQLASAVTWLRNNRRGDAHFLVHIENAAYGFRRNLYGAKPVGIIVALAVAAFGGWSIMVPPSPAAAAMPATLLGPHAGALLAIVVGIIALYAWFAMVTPAWVRAAAETYAKTLLETCDGQGEAPPRGLASAPSGD